MTSLQSAETQRSPGSAWAITALTAAYVLSQFFRSYVAVVAPEMMRDLALTPAQFGTFASAFFFAFAVAQIPLGLAFDRIGAIRPMVAFLGLGAVSASGVAFARSYEAALLAQAGLGLSCAPVFMGLIYYVYEQFDHGHAVRLTTLASAVGVIGSLLAATPLGWLSKEIGWRGAMVVFAAVTLLVAASVFAFAQEPIRERSKRISAPLSLVTFVIRDLRIYTLVPACLVMSIGGTFRNAWAGPLLVDLHHLDALGRGNVMTIVSLAAVVTAFMTTAMVRAWSPKAVSIGWLAAGLVAGIVLAISPSANIVLTAALLSLWFSVGGIHPLVMAQGRQVFPAEVRGLGLGMLNSFVFLGIALSSLGFGFIAETSFANGVAAGPVYGRLFLAAVVPLGFALLCYAFSPSGSNAEADDEPHTRYRDGGKELQ